MMDDRDHPHDLLAPYVLGACPPAEAAMVSHHVAGCASCAQETERLRVGTDALLVDVAPVTPPPEVKQRVMAQVRADAELFDAARARRERDVHAPSHRARSWRSRWGGLAGRPALAGALASTLAAIAIAAVVVSSQSGSSSRERVIAAQVDERVAPRGAATLEIEGDRRRLVVEGLPDPGRGRAYQVWVRTNREVPRPANAIFTVDSSGRGEAALPGELDDVDQVLVTSEPAGGSKLPTRRPVLQVEV